jgi:NAD-dependent SIR2 family protein deacetylase
MNREEFLRIFPLRAKGLMWLTGAGASASAGIKTAGNMIWDFKKQIFCAEQKITAKSCPDLSDHAFRARLNQYFKTKGGYPAANSDEEYAFYFEAAYPQERDRRSYIDSMVTGATPSNGCIAIAILAKLNVLRTLWTTNFDHLPEDAFAKVFGTTTSFVVSSLDTPELAEQALAEAKRPLIAKLHGDFLSRRLKNTSEELKAQDQRLRRSLVNECKRQGLIVVGYSGRDRSIIDALEEGIDGGRGFPNGLFWFRRPDSEPLPVLTQLIDRAKAAKIDAHIIEAETFDEIMMDLFILMDCPDELRTLFDQRRPRLSPVEIPPAGASWPVIRFNAVPLTSVPATCRRIVCEIGGTADVREAIKVASADVVALRREVGVIAFGADDQVRKAFKPFGITEFDLHPIDISRLEFENAEHGLLNDCLAKAFSRERQLQTRPSRHGWKLYVDSDATLSADFQKLRIAASGLSGTVTGTKIKWAEAVLIKIERKLNQTWLVFEPSIELDRDGDIDRDFEGHPRTPEEDEEWAVAKEFVRERTARRYNHVLASLLEGWLDVFLGVGNASGTVRTFGIADGIDASFTFLRTTAFSNRGGRV